MPAETINDVDRILRERWREVMAVDRPDSDDNSAIVMFAPNRGRYYYVIVESRDAEYGGWFAFRVDRDTAVRPFFLSDDCEFVGHRPTAGQCAVLVVALMDEQP